MPLLGTQPGGNRSGPWTPGTAPGARMTPSLARRCWSEWAGPRARWVLGLPTDCLKLELSLQTMEFHGIGCNCGFAYTLKGLGRSGQGATEHIKVRVKNDSYGLGANAADEVRIYLFTHPLSHSLKETTTVQHAVIVSRFAMIFIVHLKWNVFIWYCATYSAWNYFNCLLCVYGLLRSAVFTGQMDFAPGRLQRASCWTE